MCELTTWVKPNGREVEINDLKATVDAAEALGWKRADQDPTAIKDMKADQLKERCKEAGIDYDGKDNAIEVLEKIEADKAPQE